MSTSSDKFVSDIKKELVKRFTKAGVVFTSKTRGYLNASQPYRRTKSGKHIGLAPSLPGQFPRKLSGQLMRSITWKFDTTKMVLTVGANLKGYPSFLQTGTKHMKPRPWLSLAFDKEKSELKKILVG
jgi:hypothetical protein